MGAGYVITSYSIHYTKLYDEGGLQEASKRFERAMLEHLYPQFPSSRQLAQRLGISHTAVANKLREHGLGKPAAAGEEEPAG